MAKRASTVVGIEIEPAAIHAAAVSIDGGISINQAAIVPLEAGVVRDGEVHDVEGLATALKALYRDNKGLNKRVRIGVANQKIVVRVLDLPPIRDRKELQAAVRFQAQDEIPMPLDSSVLDFQPLGIVDTEAGPRQRVLIVAARRDMIERVLGAARSAGLRPEGIDLAAFAMVRALHRMGGSGAVLYLAIGGLTNLAVADGPNCLFTRVVGGGMEAIAVELAERKGLTLEQARGWLTRIGLITPRDTLNDDGHAEIADEARNVLVDGVRRIGGEVRNSLDFHHAQEGATTAVQRAVLTGTAAGVPGFAEALSVELGMAVEVAAVDGSPADVDPALLSVAAGLAVA